MRPMLSSHQDWLELAGTGSSVTICPHHRVRKGFRSGMVCGRLPLATTMHDFKVLLRELALVTAAIVIGLSPLAAVAALSIRLQAHQEAPAFNRFTAGPKATAWVELRVEADR